MKLYSEEQVNKLLDGVSEYITLCSNGLSIKAVFPSLPEPVMEVNGWISVKDRLPELFEKDYSKNVLAICDGELMVMCYCYNHSEDDDLCGYFWANCYGKIDGDAELDDDYYPTHWMPLPTPPKQ